MIAAVLVGLFGMLGALLRFTVDSVFAARPAAPSHDQPSRKHWPWATLLVNATGCFIIGLVLGGTAGLPAGEWQTGLAAGLAGGLTTFSSWTTATVKLLAEARPAAAAVNIAANLGLGLAAAAAGAALTL